MRILDSEAHAIHPRGIDSAYPTHPKWRYPYIPGPMPTLRSVVAESVAKCRFDDLTDELLARMDRHGVEKTVIMRGAFPARNADMAAIGTDETTRQWWSLTDPMQAPLPERK